MNYFAMFAERQRPEERELVVSAVDEDEAGLRALLAATPPTELDAEAVRTHVSGHLGQLTAQAFQYFLPALMTLVVDEYESLRDFAAELVGALTEPAREDVVTSFGLAAQIPAEMGVPAEMLGQLQEQQLEWFDSGEPSQAFAARVAGLSSDEQAAVLDFLVKLRDGHGEDFPFAEPERAIMRYWGPAAKRPS